ncbi:MAG TPA: hypothetical protein VGH16_11335 [Candidatus Binatia bacterium]|jgi:uncharacterized integral membrane protein
MYFKTAQYPEFQHRSKKEQTNLLVSAVLQNKWIVRRIVVIFLIAVSAPTIVGMLASHFDLPKGLSLLAVFVSGVFFCAYTLWEINGPIHDAVSKHMNTNHDLSEARQ